MNYSCRCCQYFDVDEAGQAMCTHMGGKLPDGCPILISEPDELTLFMGVKEGANMYDEWKVSPLLSYGSKRDKSYLVQRCVDGHANYTIAEVTCWADRTDALETATLISASREMRDALQTALHTIECLAMVTGYEGDAHFGTMEQISLALKKAAVRKEDIKKED